MVCALFSLAGALPPTLSSMHYQGWTSSQQGSLICSSLCPDIKLAGKFNLPSLFPAMRKYTSQALALVFLFTIVLLCMTASSGCSLQHYVSCNYGCHLREHFVTPYEPVSLHLCLPVQGAPCESAYPESQSTRVDNTCLRICFSQQQHTSCLIRLSLFGQVLMEEHHKVF